MSLCHESGEHGYRVNPRVGLIWVVLGRTFETKFDAVSEWSPIVICKSFTLCYLYADTVAV